MPKTQPLYSEQAIIEAFHALAPIGEDILMPLSMQEDTLNRQRQKNENAITSYLHRFDFGDYFFSIVYTPRRSDLTAAPSTLEARICLDKTETTLFFMSSDIIPYINPQDMICRYFPFIESPERLKSCYIDLVRSLIPYLDDFARLASEEETRSRAYRDLKGEMSRCYNENIDTPSGKGEDYDRLYLALRFAHFVRWKSSFYASDPYGEYLAGNTTALSAVAFRGTRPDYIKHIAISSLGKVEDDYLPVRPSSASLSSKTAALKKTKTPGVLAATLAYTLPLVFLILGGIYFGIATLMAEGTAYYTALSFAAFSENIIFLVLISVLLSLSLTPLTLRLFFKKRFQKAKVYLAMEKTNKVRVKGEGFKLFLLTLTTVMIIFSALRGVQFREDSIRQQSGFIPMSVETVDYDEIESVRQVDRKNGSYYYIITLQDGVKLNLKDYMTKSTCDDVADRLVPIFNRHGIAIEIGDSTDHKDITNQA